MAGGRQGLGDRRGQYLDGYLHLLATFMPKVALLENVRGFLSGRTSALQHISGSLDELERLTGIRYRVEHRVLDAADHGVAERRARAIVVLTRSTSCWLGRVWHQRPPGTRSERGVQRDAAQGRREVAG